MATPIYPVTPQPSKEYPSHLGPTTGPEVAPSQPAAEMVPPAAPVRIANSGLPIPDGRHLQTVQAVLQEPELMVQPTNANVGIEEVTRSVPGRLQDMAEENSQPLDVHLMNLEAGFAQAPAGPQP